MKPSIASILLLALAASIPSVAFGQQAPNNPANAPTPGFAPAESAPAFRANQVGDTTRYVLQLQAEGSQAGKPLPMLGDEATASYRRYLKSFNHDIPDFYDSPVGKTDNGGR
jgi:hypothetical protein